jgi:hypothetical protein
MWYPAMDQSLVIISIDTLSLMLFKKSLPLFIQQNLPIVVCHTYAQVYSTPYPAILQWHFGDQSTSTPISEAIDCSIISSSSNCCKNPSGV